MTRMKTQIQQGDVIIESAAIPAGAKPLNHRVLREGEHTGHKHLAVIDEPAVALAEAVRADVTLFMDEASGKLFMRVSGGVARVVHEEHNPVTVPPGEYEIGAVREYDYDTEESRFVLD